MPNCSRSPRIFTRWLRREQSQSLDRFEYSVGVEGAEGLAQLTPSGKHAHAVHEADLHGPNHTPRRLPSRIGIDDFQAASRTNRRAQPFQCNHVDRKRRRGWPTMPVAPIRTTRMVSLRRPLGRCCSEIGSEGDGLPALHRVAACLFLGFDDLPGV